MFNRDVRLAKRILDKIWQSDVEKINDHLPKEFKTLSQLLKSDTPNVVTKSGSLIIFDKDELNLIAKIIPQNFQNKLKLPIILLRRLDLGRGIYQVLGGKIEAYTILKILYRNNPDKSPSINDINLPLYLYRPQVFELKKLLKTSLVIGFSFSTRSYL